MGHCVRVSCDGILSNYQSSFMFKKMALWVEMDLLTLCTLFTSQSKSLFDLSDLVGYRNYHNVEFCFQFKIPKTIKICRNGWPQLSGFIVTKVLIRATHLAELFVMHACNYGEGDSGVHTLSLFGNKCPFYEKNYMSCHIKILILRSKSSMEVHEFDRIFHAGKSVSTSLRYLTFKVFWGCMPPRRAQTHGKIESALIQQ